MKKKHLVIGLVITIVLLCGVICFFNRDYSFSFVRDEKYGLSVKVNKYIGRDSVIVLPTKIGIWDVVEYDESFLNNERIKVVTIPEGNIAYPKFQDDNYIQVVFFDNNCTAIPDSFFEGCCNLRDVNGLLQVKTIGANAFRGCSKLENVDFSYKLEVIGDGAFEGTDIVDIDHGMTIYSEEENDVVDKYFELCKVESITEDKVILYSLDSECYYEIDLSEAEDLIEGEYYNVVFTSKNQIGENRYSIEDATVMLETFEECIICNY